MRGSSFKFFKPSDKLRSIVLSTYGSNYTLAINHHSSFQLMKRLCDDTSPFSWLLFGRIRGAFSGEGRAEGPSTSVVHLTVQGRRVVLANELNPVLTS